MQYPDSPLHSYTKIMHRIYPNWYLNNLSTLSNSLYMSKEAFSKNWKVSILCLLGQMKQMLSFSLPINFCNSLKYYYRFTNLPKDCRALSTFHRKSNHCTATISCASPEWEFFLFLPKFKFINHPILVHVVIWDYRYN